jgi:hypothetical protein
MLATILVFDSRKQKEDVMRLLTLAVLIIFGYSNVALAFSKNQNNWSAENIHVSCMELDQLRDRLQSVVNVQQVFNNDRKTWNEDGCSVDSVNLVYYADPYTARQAGVSKNRAQSLGFVGWIVTDKWLVPVQKIQFTNRFTAFRPASVYSRKTYSLPKRCMDRIKPSNQKPYKGVEIIGHQFSVGNVTDYWYQELCALPVYKNAVLNYPPQQQQHSHSGPVQLNERGEHRHGNGPYHQH